MDGSPRVRIEAAVQFFDTDCGGVAHNLAYLRFVEAARSALLASLGFPLAGMTASGLFPAVLRTEMNYRRPAMLGDAVAIEAALEALDRVRFLCGFRLCRPGAEESLAEGRQWLAWVQMPAGRPAPAPEAWRTAYPELVRRRLEIPAK